MVVDVELAEIRDFLARHEPFAALPVGVLDRLPRRLGIEYFRRGRRLVSVGRRNDHMYILRSGAADVHDADGSFVDRGEAGACLGWVCALAGAPALHDVSAIEDSLALTMPVAVLRELIEAHPQFAAHFDTGSATRMAGAATTLQESTPGGAILRTSVRDLMHREPITAPSSTSIQEAAATMARRSVSSLLIVDGDRLAGILTDRDLRSRVLAVGLDPRQPVSEVMTSDPVTTSPDVLAFEVLLTMVGRGIHHLPVVDAAGAPLGMVTTTDVVRLEQANPVYLTGDIAKQESVEGIAASARRLPPIVAALVAQGAGADEIGRVVTAVGDAIERQLITVVHARLGPAPVPYAWVTLGSRARLEQALGGDQDHALMLGDEAIDPTTGQTAPQVDAWFASFAQEVVGGLEQCGYPRCAGDVMATNPLNRQPLSRWRERFSTWLGEPMPEAVLQASIFFDLRHLAGDGELTATLQQHVLARAHDSGSFLAHLAAAAVRNGPPIGFFRGFVLEKAGEHADLLDIKRGGIGSVVELARVHALAIGAPAVNTRARIDAAQQAGVLGAERAADLRDAFDFISYVRLRHQARQVGAGQAPDNHIDPGALSGFDKRHLRSAFGIIRDAQSALAQRYSTTFVS